MKLLNALLLDNIVKHPDGRVDLLGLFEAIYFEQVPFILDSLSIFVEVEIETADRESRHTLELQMFTHDGKPASDPTTIQFMAPSAVEYPRSVAQLDLALFKVPFNAFGEYKLRVVLDGVPAREIPLEVAHP